MSHLFIYTYLFIQRANKSTLSTLIHTNAQTHEQSEHRRGRAKEKETHAVDFHMYVAAIISMGKAQIK